MANELDNLKELVIGQTLEVPLEFLDDYDEPVDLFGSTLYFSLKDSPRNPDGEEALLVSLVFPDDQDSATGLGTLVIDSDDWASVIPKQYYWSLTRVITADVPQKVYPHSSGKVNVVSAPKTTYA